MSFEKVKELIGKEVEVFGNREIVSEVKHNGSYLDEIVA